MISKTNKKKKLIIGFLIPIGIVMLIIIILITIYYIRYNEAVEMFSSGRYYEAMNKYYNSLGIIYKKKFNKIIINKIGKYRWKSDVYTNFNDCTCYDYVEIENDMTNNYIVCIDDENQEKHQWSGTDIINFKYNPNETNSSHFALKFSGSNSLYLFVYPTEELIIAEGSVHTVNGITQSKLHFTTFHEEK